MEEIMTHDVETHIHDPDPPRAPEANLGVVRWPEEHCAALREHMLMPGKSFQQIATLLNEQFGTSYTRNSTIGRASRMGVKSLNPSGVTMTQKKPRQRKEVTKTKYVRATHNSKSAVRPVTEIEMVKLRCVEIEPQHVSVTEVDGCRYPYGGFVRAGEPETPITFCNHPQVKGSSFCGPHHALCWVPANKTFGAPRKYFGTDFAA